MNPVAKVMNLNASRPFKVAVSLLLFACWIRCAEADPSAVPVVVTPAVEPWGYYDEEARPVGLLMAFQEALFARANVSLQYQLQPYARVIYALASGQADVGVMFVSPAAERAGISLGEVAVTRIVLIAAAQGHSGTPGKKRVGLADFAHARVGFVRGSKYGPIFDDNTSFEHVPVTNVSQGLRMLMTGRLDAMVSSEQALLYAIHLTEIPASSLAFILELGVAKADLYVSRHSAQGPWLAKLRQAMSDMKADGSLHKIFYQHHLWPRQATCFAEGGCLQADEPPSSVSREPM